MNFSTAEEIDQQKSKIRKERKLRLTKDRKDKYGDSSFVQTDGLKIIRTGTTRNTTIVLEDQEIDLRRVRSIRDVLTEEDFM